jgi:KDO2-lipid IV(A) lauroyltransferase
MDKGRFQTGFLSPRYWPTWIGLGVLWLIVQLPYRVLYYLGQFLGHILLYLAKRRRHITETNIKLCFPELGIEQQNKLVLKNFQSTALAIFESAIIWWWPTWRLRKLVTIDGLETLEQSNSQGIILFAMHFTTLEIGAGFLSMHHPIDGLYRRHKNAVFDYIQRRGRERHNQQGSVIARDDLRGIVKALKQGRVVWYAPDQDMGHRHSVFAPFFGIPTATVTATAKLARLSNAIVVPFTQTRLDKGRGYRLRIHSPIIDFPSGDEYLDACRINAIIEHQIRLQPEQYLWMHRRFKTRPTGEPSPYLNLDKRRQTKEFIPKGASGQK